MKEDLINPSHYKAYRFETITISRYMSFCRGNALKYLMRYKHKGTPVLDLKKAIWYIKEADDDALDCSIFICERMTMIKERLVKVFCRWCYFEIPIERLIEEIEKEIKGLLK